MHHLEPKSPDGQRRWVVAAGAVEGYDPPNDGRQWPRREHAAPAGCLGVEEFARRVGLPKATLYRRLAQWGLETVKRGNRRWIPVDHLARFGRGQTDNGKS